MWMKRLALQRRERYDTPARVSVLRIALAITVACLLHLQPDFSQNLGAIVAKVDTIWSPGNSSRIVPMSNAQSAFTSAELTAVNGFFQSSGSTFLLGSGALWLATHPGSTLDQYPMNQIGSLCGYRWIDGLIVDPVHNSNGRLLFLCFYPAVELQSFPNALAFIDSVATAYPTNIRQQRERHSRQFERHIGRTSFLRRSSHRV